MTNKEDVDSLDSANSADIAANAAAIAAETAARVAADNTLTTNLAAEEGLHVLLLMLPRSFGWWYHERCYQSWIGSVPYSHNAQSVGAAPASNLGNIFDGATNNGVLIATGNNNGFSFTPINVTSKLEVYLRVNDTDVMIEYYHDAHDRFYKFSLPTGADIPFEGWYEFPITPGDLPTTVSKIQFDNPGSIGTVVRPVVLTM